MLTLKSLLSKMIFILSLLVFCNSIQVMSSNDLSKLANCRIIPQPNMIELESGCFRLKKNTMIHVSDSNLLLVAKQLTSQIYSDFGLKLNVSMVNHNYLSNSIRFNLVSGIKKEAYEIKVTRHNIVCTASSESGFFYAIQSLVQSVHTNGEVFTIPNMKIADAPRFEWRGFMLDESRHFFGKATVMQYINLMAKLKLNRFHWHLTDEPAWRIEIKKYPLLTEIGSYGTWDDSKAPKAFYTQNDIKEIVAYAAAHHVMIIPEIDMPGHATSATRSYPYLSGGGKGRWNGFTFHPTKDSTYEFINDVFTEVAALFPGPYIHVGADEVHYGNQYWFTDSIIQQFIKDKNLKDEVGLEHYFLKRVNEIVLSKGKIMIGWDEIVNIDLNPEKVIVMWWRHDKPELLEQALKKGYKVILTPRVPCYFDFVQDSTHLVGRIGKDNLYKSLVSVYNFPDNSKYIPVMSVGFENQIMGIQASLWTERIKDKKRLDFMTFPRLIAMSEAAWSSKEKDYTAFEVKLQGFMKYLKDRGIYFFNIFDKNTTPEPDGPSKPDVIGEG